MTIKTDHKWKNLKYRNEVPDKVLQDQFSHLDDEMDGFLHYAKRWWHVSDFLRIENNSELKGWTGYSSDTYFSGAVIRLSKDGEQYQIGYYFS